MNFILVYIINPFIQSVTFAHRYQQLYAVLQVLTSQQEVEEGGSCTVDSSDHHTCEDSELEGVPPYLLEEHAHGE